MFMIEIESFFSLKKFAHKALWKEGEPVWSPLYVLDAYFEKKTYEIEIEIPLGVHLLRPELISIGKGTVIEPGVCIQGPCIIGKNCIIRHGAFLRDGVICGDHCAIGHSAEIKHAILLNYAHITHFTYVGDSIVGNWVNLGAGAKCANLRLDRRIVEVSFGAKKIKTGLKKFGAIIGDKVQIGCNCVLNPGTLMGKESVSYPLLNLGGYIPPWSRVVSDRPWRVESVHRNILEELGKNVTRSV
jgi:NDP-sugar pyrophosphorylase family protein